MEESAYLIEMFSIGLEKRSYFLYSRVRVDSERGGEGVACRNNNGENNRT